MACGSLLTLLMVAAYVMLAPFLGTNLASLLVEQGKWKDAEKLLREALEEGLQIYPEDHPTLLIRYTTDALPGGSPSSPLPFSSFLFF